MIDLHPATSDLQADVLAGLRASPRYFPSKDLYDARGAVLFEQITEQPTYYPTRTEISILEDKAPEIRAAVGANARIIEPGSGAGLKTRLLLSQLDAPASYMPIDIAKDQLIEAAADLQQAFPDIRVQPVCGDFTQPLHLPRDASADSTCIFFPGSTIGNFETPVAVGLLREMGDLCRPNGGVLVGVDLPKEPELLLDAYNEEAGVSAAFALNILRRYNDDLGTDFDAEQFVYEAHYDPDNYRIEMGLRSRCEQRVSVGDETFLFEEGEWVRTEYSYKYPLDVFRDLAEQAGLQQQYVWKDPKGWFSVQYLTPAPS